MRKLLFAFTIFVVPVSAYAQGGQFYNEGDPQLPHCVAKYCFDDEILVELTPSEQEQLDLLKVRMARIIANAGERMEQRAKQEAAREAFRRSQCTVPLLWIGCPAKSVAR